MPLIEAHALCKYYRPGGSAEVRAVDDVSLQVPGGAFLAVSGPSGSGKTTLLALLGALERPTRGGISFADKDLARCSDVELARVRRRLGFVFQDFALIGNLTAEENITYPLIPRGLTRSERQRRARLHLARFGLESKLTTRAGELSGGEQQRVALARALAGEPDVLFADEPTSNLDAETSMSLLTVFQELHARGTTLIVASHDPRVVALATAVATIERGRLQNQASVEA